MVEENEPGNPSQQSAPDSRRRPYASPRLIEYGPVSRLTLGSKSVNSDFPQGGFQFKT